MKSLMYFFIIALAGILMLSLMVFRTILNLLIRLLCLKHEWMVRGNNAVCTKCGRIGHLNGGHKIKKASIFEGLF